MTEKKKSNPTWKHQELPLNKPVRVTLKGAKPVSTGTNSMGTWNMWVVNVDKSCSVCLKDKTPVPNYEGEAIVFPPEGLHKAFQEATNGTKEGVVVEVMRTIKENKNGQPYKEYECKVVGEGSSPPNSLSNLELKFVEAMKFFVEKKIIEGNKEDFFGWAKNDSYGFTDDAQIEKMWRFYEESKTK